MSVSTAIVMCLLLLCMSCCSSSLLDYCMLVSLLVMNYLLELIMNLPNIPTIQKPNYRQFPELTMAGFADALRPDKFTGVHFKRWQVKTTLWLTALKVFHASVGAPEGMTDEDRRKFQEANTMFVGCILSVLADRLCDVYMHINDGKILWDALNAKFGATDAGSELYIMESFHD